MKFPKLISHDLRDERLIFNIVGKAIGKILLVTPLTANQLTVIRNILNLPVYYLFVKATSTTYLWGGLICLVVLILDVTDGYIAITKKSKSKFGGWMEEVFDTLFFSHYTLLGFFLALGIFFRTGNTFIWILLYMNLFGSFANNLIIKKELSLSGGDRAETIPTKKNIFLHINENVRVIDMWSNHFMCISAIFYGLFLKIGIDSVFVLFVFLTFTNQIRWIGRIVLRLVSFSKEM